MKTCLFRTVIVITLSYFIAVSSGFCQITEPVGRGLVEFNADTTDLEIDGYCAESSWSQSIHLNGLFLSPSDFGGNTDLSGSIKMFYTSYAFYFYADIHDDIAHNYNGTDGNSWSFDNVELYFNIDTTNIYKSGLYYPDGIQLRFNRGLDLVNSVGFGNGEPSKTNYDVPGLKFKQIDYVGGWQVEVEIPWKYILPSGSKPEDIIDYIGKTIGFDVTFSDSDGSDPMSGYRDAMLALDHDGLTGDEDNAWQDVRKFGLLELLLETNANAGKDQTIVSDGKSEYQVVLNGGNSRGMNNTPITYKWYSLNNIEIKDSTNVSPSVNLPFSGYTTTYDFVLQVTDTNNLKDTDTVHVFILNNPPVADAGEDQNILANEMVTLDGSGSFDIEKSQLTYFWQSLDSIDLSNTNSIYPTFIASENQNDTIYRFTLTVNDGEYDSEEDTIFVFVERYTGIYSHSEENILVYPNPIRQNLQIQIEGKDCNQYLFIVTDIKGIQIYKGKITGAETTINTMECGIKLNELYLIQVYNNEDVLIHTERIIVQ